MPLLFAFLVKSSFRVPRPPHRQTDTKRQGQTDARKEKQAERGQTDEQTDRQTNRRTVSQPDGLTDRSKARLKRMKMKVAKQKDKPLTADAYTQTAQKQNLYLCSESV